MRGRLQYMGVNATGTLGVAGRAPKTRESRRRRRRGGWGLGRGSAPPQKIYEVFISKWCDMVHSGCVVIKIHVSSSAEGKKLTPCQNIGGQHRTTPAGQILGSRDPCNRCGVATVSHTAVWLASAHTRSVTLTE